MPITNNRNRENNSEEIIIGTGSNLGVILNKDFRDPFLGFIPALNIDKSFTLVKEGRNFHAITVRKEGRWLTLPKTKYKVFVDSKTPLSIDPPEFKIPCKNDYDVFFDVKLTFTIKDAARFYEQNKSGQLQTIVEDKLRHYILEFVGKNTYEELKEKTSGLRGQQNTLTIFANVLKPIEKKYGIEITAFYMQNLRQPQFIIDSIEKKEAQKRQNEINEEAAESKRRIAETNRKIAKIETETILENIDIILDEFHKKGITDKKLIEDCIIARLTGANVNITRGSGNAHITPEDGINFGIGLNAINNGQPVQQNQQPVQQNFQPNSGQMRRR